MMQRPRAVTLVGWFFIASGIIGLLLELPFPTGPSFSQIVAEAGGILNFGVATASRLLAVLGGVLLLKGLDLGRWLLVVWMGGHIVLSLMHSVRELALHVILFTVISYFLFRPASNRYLRGEKAAAG